MTTRKRLGPSPKTRMPRFHSKGSHKIGRPKTSTAVSVLSLPHRFYANLGQVTQWPPRKPYPTISQRISSSPSMRPDFTREGSGVNICTIHQRIRRNPSSLLCASRLYPDVRVCRRDGVSTPSFFALRSCDLKQPNHVKGDGQDSQGLEKPGNSDLAETEGSK